MYITTLLVLFLIRFTKKSLFYTPCLVRRHFGEATLRILRQLVKLNKKVEKSNADICFLTTCIMYNLTPKMTRFKLHKTSATKTPLAQRFRTNLLRSEIKFHKRRIKQLKVQIASLESSLYSSVTWLFGIRIKAFVKKDVDNYIKSCKSIHKQKLINLGLTISFDKNESAIFNDTDVKFDDKETELLSMGLKHGYFPSYLNLKEVQAAFEDLFVQVAPHFENRSKLLQFKNCLTNCYNDYVGNYFHSKRTNYYFSEEVHKLIKSIQNKMKIHDIIILKADKGQTVVIMYRKNYVEKMNVILNDSSKFVKVDKEDTLNNLTRFQSFIYRNFRSIFSESEYKDIYPTASNIPVMYGLPKIHKDGAPLRPILSMFGCYNHAFAQWIGRQLSDLRKSRHVTKDSFSLDFLKNSQLNGCYFVSYDVISLFTNIPLDETINLILTALYPKIPNVAAKGQLFNGMTKTIFKNSLNHCLKDNVFVFNGIFYKQIDGCAMGSPLAPILADIFMNHLLETKISREQHDFLNVTFVGNGDFSTFFLRVFIRYVDDTLAVFENEEDADRFLNYLNSLHPNIKFTCDKEVSDKLPLLDLLLIKDSDSNVENISVTVYRKPTHSGVFTHFLSFVPFRYKIGLVKTLFDRAFKICSNWKLLHNELEKIVYMLSLNGYRKNFTYKIISKELDNRVQTGQKPIYEGPEKLKIYFKLPYIGDISKKVRECINNSLPGKLKLIYTNTYSKLGHKFGFKDKQPKILKHDVVYRITCSCKRKYYGETSRPLKVRFDEHIDINSSSEVGRHLASSPGCHITFDDCEIIAHESNMYKRRLIESLFIAENNDGNLLNDNTKSVPLYLFNLPSYNEQQRGRIFTSF